jgi:hypothetical protein
VTEQGMRGSAFDWVYTHFRLEQIVCNIGQK